MAQKKRGTGTGNRQQPDDEDDDEGGGGAISDEMRGELTSLVNAAVSGQLNRKLPNAIKNAVDAGLAPVLEQLRTGGKRSAAADDDDNADDDDQDLEEQPRGGKRGAAGGRQPAVHRRAGGKDPETQAMAKRLAAIEEERKVEREQARNRDRDGLLREQLTAAGVEPNRLRGAVAVLRDYMKYDEKAAEWGYVAKRDGYDEDLDVGAGVKEWASTDEGKSYLAPPSKGGAGNGGQQRANGGTGTRVQQGGRTGVVNGGKPIADPKAQKAERRAEAVNNLSNAIGELGGATIGIG